MHFHGRCSTVPLFHHFIDVVSKWSICISASLWSKWECAQEADTPSYRHLLSNIAQVVARNSSWTSADLQNLFTSLCEDSLIYPGFTGMKGSYRSQVNEYHPFTYVGHVTTHTQYSSSAITPVQAHIVQHLELPQTTSLSHKKSVNYASQLAMPSISSASSASNGTCGILPSSFSHLSDVGNPASHTGGGAPSPNNSNGPERGWQLPPRISGGRTSHESRRGAPANGALTAWK